MLFSFASNKPRTFGNYKQHARQDIDELLAHYEEDLIESVKYLDEEDTTRLA